MLVARSGISHVVLRRWLALHSSGGVDTSGGAQGSKGAHRAPRVIQRPRELQQLARGLGADMSAREARRIYRDCAYQVRPDVFGVPHKKIVLWWEGQLDCCADGAGSVGDAHSDTSNSSDDEFSDEQAVAVDEELEGSDAVPPAAVPPESQNRAVHSTVGSNALQLNRMLRQTKKANALHWVARPQNNASMV